MICMINKIIAIQGDHPQKLNPVTDTSIFLEKNIYFQTL